MMATTLNIIFYQCFGILLGLGLAFLLLTVRRSKPVSKVVKVLAVLLVVLSFIDLFLPDLFTMRGLADSRLTEIAKYPGETFNVYPGEVFNSYRNIFHAIIRLGNAAGIVSIPFAIFYKKPHLTKFVTFIVLPFSLVNAAIFYQYIGYFTSPLAPSVFGEASRVVLQDGIVRMVYFGVLNLLQILLSIYVALKNVKHLKFHSFGEVMVFIAISIGLLLTNMPISTLQHLVGNYTTFILTMGYPGHFAFIGLIVIEFIALLLIFRKQSKENQYILVLIMALSLIFQYNSFFKTDGIINAQRWPLQLCNIAGFFILITLLTKSNKMFHFTLVVNTIGAVIAIAICDSTFNTGILYCMNIHYMVEHINVLLIPILCGAFKLFEPLKAKDVKHVWIGFAIYWLIVLAIGTTLNVFYAKDVAVMGESVAKSESFFRNINYLFMFNKEASTNLLGFVAPFFDIKFSIGPVTFYLVQALVLVGFEAICTLFYFAFYPLFKGKKLKEAK